jgi:hypothetical protein
MVVNKAVVILLVAIHLVVLLEDVFAKKDGVLIVLENVQAVDQIQTALEKKEHTSLTIMKQNSILSFQITTLLSGHQEDVKQVMLIKKI